MTTWWAIGFVVALFVGWNVIHAAVQGPEVWKIQGANGGTVQTVNSKERALRFACNTNLIDTGFVLTSPSGEQMQVPAGADTCSGRHMNDG